MGYFTHYFHPPPAEKSGTSRLCAGLSETRGIWICDCRDHSMDDSLSRLSQRVHSTSQIVYRRPAFSGDQRVHRCRVADCTATDPAWHSHAGQRLGWKLMKRWPVFWTNCQGTPTTISTQLRIGELFNQRYFCSLPTFRFGSE